MVRKSHVNTPQTTINKNNCQKVMLNQGRNPQLKTKSNQTPTTITITTTATTKATNNIIKYVKVMIQFNFLGIKLRRKFEKGEEVEQLSKT